MQEQVTGIGQILLGILAIGAVFFVILKVIGTFGKTADKFDEQSKGVDNIITDAFNADKIKGFGNKGGKAE